MDDFFLVLFSLLGVIGLIFLTYYGARWMNKKFRPGGQGFNSSKGIKIVECVGIASDKQLIIVTVGKKSMLLGVTPTAVNKICDLDNDDMSVIEKASADAADSSFLNSFKKAFAEHQKFQKFQKSEHKEELNNRTASLEDKDGSDDKDDF